MIIVDTALKRRLEANDPLRVGLVGAGFMGRGVALQIEQFVPAMKVVALANRDADRALDAYRLAGVDDAQVVDTVDAVNDMIATGRRPVVTDPALMASAMGVDVILDATSDVEWSAYVTMAAIDFKKHIVTMNSDMDATVGPIMKVKADRAGIVYTNTDGDQPGSIMNLYRFVDSVGYNPVMAGNIKGFQNEYRTPDTQEEFAAKFGLSPRMATTFADGTKMSMENAAVANATGFKVGKRGMYGPTCEHVDEAIDLFPIDQLLEHGLVDYLLGAKPGPGVFVLGYSEHPVRQTYMRYFKLGEGPLYCFYTPYHLAHLEAPLTAARAALLGDTAVVPLGAPVCEVVTVAKKDMEAGEVLDGVGGYTAYGQIENAETAVAEDALLMGLADGCRLVNAVKKDQLIRWSDVEPPEGRLAHKLRTEQDAHFGSA